LSTVRGVELKVVFTVKVSGALVPLHVKGEPTAIMPGPDVPLRGSGLKTIAGV
jgi:hypothetical protein